MEAFVKERKQIIRKQNRLLEVLLWNLAFLNT